MSDLLAGAFAPVDIAQWRERADAADASTPLEDGLLARWLYVREDALAADPGGAPGRAPFVRGSAAGGGWEIRQLRAEPEPAAARAAILDDLEGGVSAVALRLDRAARTAAVPGTAAFAERRGRDGAAVSTLDDLDATLDGVYLELAPVALEAGAQALSAGALLLALWRRRAVATAAAAGSLGCDPLGTLAAEGALPQPLEAALAEAGALAAEVDATLPRVRALAVDTRAYADAGATAAQELGIALATGVAYLRACATAGLAPARAAARIELTVAIGADQFLELAKLRALRRTWARVLEASGAPPAARRSPIVARTSGRMLTGVDPWVNMLRVTTAAFAAAVGGADAITVAPFDAALGADVPPSGLARRVARNTQLILQEESALGRVADPGGGSWYVESLTDALAQAAWARFQALEAAGGIAAALVSGAVAADVAAAADARADEIARRVRQLTGVTSYPLLADDGAERADAPDLAALARLDAARLAERAPLPPAALDRLRAAPATRRLRRAAELAADGARIDELAAALAGEAPLVAAPLPRRRDGAPFERLRAAAAAHERAGGERPRILLACLGAPAQHVGAATWARSFFEAGGLHAIQSAPLAAPADAAAALAAEGIRIAAVCAGPLGDPADVAAAVAALRAAGAATVYLAPASVEEATAAGADAAVHDGVDMLDVLGDALARLGIAHDAREAPR